MYVMSQDYRRIEKSIEYLASNLSGQASLKVVADASDLSPAQFQRIFTRWAGVDPMKFVHCLRQQSAGESRNGYADLFDAGPDTEPGRRHASYVSIVGMTADDYKNGGRSLTLSYSVHESPFGDMMMASTDRGICKMSFEEEGGQPEEILRKEFPNAKVQNRTMPEHTDALHLFRRDTTDIPNVTLHVKGTPFQISVWRELLQIPTAEVRSYSVLAKQIGKPKASRAVGSAVAKNPVAYLIPCHRVIQSTGHFGNYRWGKARKAAMIGWERVKADQR